MGCDAVVLDGDHHGVPEEREVLDWCAEFVALAVLAVPLAHTPVECSPFFGDMRAGREKCVEAAACERDRPVEARLTIARAVVLEGLPVAAVRLVCGDVELKRRGVLFAGGKKAAAAP